ncbi:MAG: trimethylamine methyltransferase family protein [Roseovarius sp.]|nr:trimethylamine methyltransferase family protein [Roseovarius sp.]MCY4314949.1 trimethylamine methyltransferase family protein [Roseovarius sp.]
MARRKSGKNTAPPDRSLRYRNLKHPFAPQTVFSEDEVASIHDTALRVLEELGMKILLDEARDTFSESGAIVDGDMVRIGRDLVNEAIRTAPSRFELRCANPERTIDYKNGALFFRPGAGCPNCSDRIRRRRPGTLRDFEETIKLSQNFEVIHGFGPCVEPQDIPVQFRHYETMRAQLEFGDKPMFVYSRGRAQVHQSLEMIQLGLDLDDEEFSSAAWATTNINTNSPRLLDRPMAQGIIDFARARQLLVITPFCLAGAMAPITVAGALALQHAEALACITLAQMAKPGSPVSYGGFSSNVDMKSGSPAFGTPEMFKMQLGSGQLARHIGLPWRSAAGSASNASDMQAAMENDMGLFGCMLSNATLVIHSGGWLEGGLTFGYEKFINDIEMLQSLAELCHGVSASDAEIGYDAMREVNPGGHFFAAAHTMERYRTAFYEPLVANLDNFGTWNGKGARNSFERATDLWQSALNSFVSPSTGKSARERIRAYVESNVKKGGAPLLD